LTPVAPYILYWHAASGTMRLGKWTTLVGAVKNANQLFFKFGGVVGFTNVVAADGTPWPGASAVKFNPVTGSPVYSSYASIPSYTEADWDADRKDVSASTYHSLANIKLGKGDPCKLVGLTVAQIRAGTINNGDWRLPTHAELVAEYSSPTYIPGSGWVNGTYPTAGIISGDIDTSFLPAVGGRNNGGVTWDVGMDGHWWSSQAKDNENCYYMYFSNGVVAPSAYTDFQYGYSVRCVPQ
jgi:hypothetical protein